MWKATRNFKRPKLPVHPIFRDNRAWAYSNKDNANEIVEYSTKVFHSPHADKGSLLTEAYDINMYDRIKLASTREINAVIKKIYT